MTGMYNEIYTMSALSGSGSSSHRIFGKIEFWSDSKQLSPVRRYAADAFAS